MIQHHHTKSLKNQHDTKATYKNHERHKTHENIAGYKKPYTKSLKTQHDTKAIYKNPERHKMHENITGYKNLYTKSPKTQHYTKSLVLQQKGIVTSQIQSLNVLEIYQESVVYLWISFFCFISNNLKTYLANPSYRFC